MISRPLFLYIQVTGMDQGNRQQIKAVQKLPGFFSETVSTSTYGTREPASLTTARTSEPAGSFTSPSLFVLLGFSSSFFSVFSSCMEKCSQFSTNIKDCTFQLVKKVKYKQFPYFNLQSKRYKITLLRNNLSLYFCLTSKLTKPF